MSQASPASSAATTTVRNGNDFEKLAKDVYDFSTALVEFAKLNPRQQVLKKGTNITVTLRDGTKEEFTLEKDVPMNQQTISKAKRYLNYKYRQMVKMYREKGKRTRTSLLPGKPVVLSEPMHEFFKEAFLREYENKELTDLARSLYALFDNSQLEQGNRPPFSRMVTNNIILNLLHAYRYMNKQDIDLGNGRMRFDDLMKDKLAPIIQKARNEYQTIIDTNRQQLESHITENVEAWMQSIDENIDVLRQPGKSKEMREAVEEANNNLEEIRKTAPIDGSGRQSFDNSFSAYRRARINYPEDENAPTSIFNVFNAGGKAYLSDAEIQNLQENAPEIYEAVQKYAKPIQNKQQVEAAFVDLANKVRKTSEAQKTVQSMPGVSDEVKDIVLLQYYLYVQRQTAKKFKDIISP